MSFSRKVPPGRDGFEEKVSPEARLAAIDTFGLSANRWPPGEEIAGARQIRRHQPVTGGNRLEGDVSTGAAEQVGQPDRVVVGHDGIDRAGGQKHAPALQVGRLRRLEHEHRAQEDGAAEGFRAQQEERSGDVRAVREADGGEYRRVETIVLPRGDDEVG